MSRNVQERSQRLTRHSDQKLFRTSTTYLFEPTDSFEEQTIASPVRAMPSHVPYFATGNEQDFVVNPAQLITSQSTEQAKIGPELTSRASRDNVEQQRRPSSPRKREGQPTPLQNFTKIQNILKEAAAGHKTMKAKLQTLKLQHSQKQSKMASPRATTPKRKQRPFTFSLSPSAAPSPKHAPPPHSPHNHRYLISGSMTERYNKRQAELEHFKTQFKLGQASSEMEECTFRPQLAAKMASARILAERERVRQSEHQHKAEGKREGEGVFITFQQRNIFQPPKKPQFKFQDFKTLIKFELERIALDK